jgi:inhibitor of KinA sporulation pathway (predicted exonuclease)
MCDYMFDYICVLDFEATCDDKGFWEHEIIEFPSILLKYDSMIDSYSEISRFQKFCKPLIKPIITPFCYQLTGITQTQIDCGLKFPDVLAAHHDWLMSLTEGNVVILTFGAWDLCTAIISEANKWKITIPYVYQSFINIKTEYSKFYNRKGCGMAKALNQLNLKLEGRHHSGIDDCYNIYRILNKMLFDDYDLSYQSITRVDNIIYRTKQKFGHKNHNHHT